MKWIISARDILSAAAQGGKDQLRKKRGDHTDPARIHSSSSLFPDPHWLRQRLARQQ